MASSKEELQKLRGAEQLMAMINRQTMAVLELPQHAREERYAIVRESFYQAGLLLGRPHAVAEEWAMKLEEFVRALVRLIEQGVGA